MNFDWKALELLFIYLFINYNTITNYILIVYKLSNFDSPEPLVRIEHTTLKLIV